MPRITSIGVYGFTLDGFLATLRGAGVTVVVDVRQRRGVRGSEYAWANSARLQAALAGAGIGYLHLKELAPTTELRRLQYREDDRVGVGKRSRVELAGAYREGYTREILDRVDLASLLEHIGDDALPALLCVERDPAACHRSLVTDRLAAEHGLAVAHLGTSS